MVGAVLQKDHLEVYKVLHLHIKEPGHVGNCLTHKESDRPPGKERRKANDVGDRIFNQLVKDEILKNVESLVCRAFAHFLDHFQSGLEHFDNRIVDLAGDG